MNTYQREYEKFKAENPDRFMKMVEATRATPAPATPAPAPAPAAAAAPEPNEELMLQFLKNCGVAVRGDENIVELSAMVYKYVHGLRSNRKPDTRSAAFAAEFERCLRAELGLELEA